MGKNTQKYDPKKLFMEGLLAWGSKFIGVKLDYSRHLTPKQRRGRKAFRAHGIARREQRRLETAR